MGIEQREFLRIPVFAEHTPAVVLSHQLRKLYKLSIAQHFSSTMLQDWIIYLFYQQKITLLQSCDCTKSDLRVRSQEIIMPWYYKSMS